MPGTNQFLPFAVGAGANTLTPTAYAALSSLLSSGFASGVANSAQFNTALRQATTAAAGLAQFVANQGINVNDDGSASNFAAGVQSAVKASIPVGRIQAVGASVAANALTFTLDPTTIDFRSTTLTSGAVSSRSISAQLTLTVPAGASLGAVNGQAARLALVAIDNAGAVELAVANLSGGINLDETTLISTTTISAGATAANVIYSTAARTNVPFRVVGFVDITQATAGTWATAPTLVQGAGGQALAAMSSLGYGQTWQNLTASRATNTVYYNTTGRPIQVCISASTSGASGSIGFSVNGVNAFSTSWNSISTGNLPVTMSTVVPPGSSYQLISGISFIVWSELR